MLLLLPVRNTFFSDSIEGDCQLKQHSHSDVDINHITDSAIRFVRIRQSLRPTVLLTCFFGAIWALAAGVSYIKDRNDNNASTVLKSIYLALAVLWFVAAAIEIYGFGAAWSQRITLVRSYFFTAVFGSLIVTGAELVRLVIHFTQKGAIIRACVGDQMDDNTAGDTITETQAQSLCSSSWSNATWWDIALLIITGLVSFFFASLAASYLHQLQNPSTLRQQTATLAPSSAYSYPLAPYSGPAFEPPQYAPPPGFPPSYGVGGGGYGAPPGPPPDGGFAAGAPYGKEKEEEWQTQATTPGTAQGFLHPRGEGESPLRREENESTDTVTLEPRRETEGRV
ncbi:hypothetical protein T439DRAFT_323423 [Meredithblackwellia eburnea MCA 4105]